MQSPRSWMFVPGNKQRFLEKAADSAADAVLFDIEDGVIPAQKAEARRMIADVLDRRDWAGPRRFVRLNALNSPWIDDDLHVILRAGIDGVCLPKVESASDIVELAGALRHFEVQCELEIGSTSILAAVESAAALQNLSSIASAHARLMGIMFGTEDYALDLGLGAQRQGEAARLVHARSTIVACARSAEIASIDGVFPNLDDRDGLEADVTHARELGFSGKSTFNPRQLPVINSIFSPSESEVAYAREVVQAFEAANEAGDASVAVGGQLVDLPIVRRAQALLEGVDQT